MLALACFFVLKWIEDTQRHRRQHRSCPGAKIFGGEILAGHPAQVIVHVLRSNVAHFTLIIDVLKQFLARQILEL